MAPPSTGRSTRAASCTVAPPSAVAGAAADKAIAAAPTVAPPLATVAAAADEAAAVAAAADVVEEMMVEIAAAADEAEDTPSKHAPSKRAPSKRNAKTAQAKTAMVPSPPLLIVLMSLVRLFHRLILLSQLLLHWLKERRLAAPRRTRHRQSLQGQGQRQQWHRPPHLLILRIHLILKSLLLQ